jgi:hypothetical protein
MPMPASDRAAGTLERLAGHGPGPVPDLCRVVLHPARPRDALSELPVRPPGGPPAPVEDDAGVARGALVDREDQSGAEPTAKSRQPRAPPFSS